MRGGADQVSGAQVKNIIPTQLQTILAGGTCRKKYYISPNIKNSTN